MTEKGIKAKAKKWLASIEKLTDEHAAIEGQMENPDDWDEFLSVGMAFGNLQEELRSLIESK